MDLDCNCQAIDSQHGRCTSLTEKPMCEARTGSREMRLIIDVCTQKNAFLLHIYPLIDLNQTNFIGFNTCWDISEIKCQIIIDQRETRLMP